jgi:copper resistance protein C
VKCARVLAVLLAAFVCAQAWAHAFLDHAEPRVGAVVPVAPLEVKLWFTEDIEPAFSSVKVVDSTGARVDKADVQVDRRDRQRISVSLQPLPAGDYKVLWRAVSIDAHVTEGDFHFHVGN